MALVFPEEYAGFWGQGEGRFEPPRPLGTVYKPIVYKYTYVYIL